jgi:hypothetical protein
MSIGCENMKNLRNCGVKASLKTLVFKTKKGVGVQTVKWITGRYRMGSAGAATIRLVKHSYSL